MNQPKNNIQSGINARNWYSHQKIRLEPDNRLSLAQILRVKSFEIIKIFKSYPKICWPCELS